MIIRNDVISTWSWNLTDDHNECVEFPILKFNILSNQKALSDVDTAIFPLRFVLSTKLKIQGICHGGQVSNYLTLVP